MAYPPAPSRPPADCVPQPGACTQAASAARTAAAASSVPSACHRPGVLPADGPTRLPFYLPGMKIGLFGGSFNPPHEAHRAVSLLGLKRIGLDRIWWLVTPGNPLKDTRQLPPLGQRIEAARTLVHHSRIDVTGIELISGTRYSYETAAWLVRRCPGVRFVWIMGADNLASFHLWRNWQGLAALLPVAIVDRDGAQSALASPAAQRLAQNRIPEARAARLPFLPPPVWVFLHGLKSPLSSSSLRHRLG
jgi:nicotinate-nucleotide adenylyltransferase